MPLKTLRRVPRNKGILQEIVREWSPEPFPRMDPQILVPHGISLTPPPVNGKRVFVLFNQKGGAGKTTSAIELAAALVALGYVVRVIDCDPQSAGLTGCLPPVLGDDVPEDPEDRTTIKQVMYGKRGLDDATYFTAYENLYVVPSYLDAQIVELDSRIQRESTLRRAIEKSKAPIDIEILDCPPSLGKFATYAAAAADDLLVPLQVSAVDAKSLPETFETVEAAQEEHPHVAVRAVLMTGYTRIDYARDLALQIQKRYPQAIIAPMRRSKSAATAAKDCQPIREHDPLGTTASDYDQFTRLIVPPKEDS